MAKVPFELHIESICPGQGSRVLTCTELLRHVRGKRRVYAARLSSPKSARLENQDVIAKIYETRFRARSQLMNEWRGIGRLQAKGLNSPQLHFYGRTENGKWILVTERIKNSTTALELYLETNSAEEKLNVLRLLFRELGRLNNAGVIQKDLHLGNFLISDNKVFSLDTAKMKFLSEAVSRIQSLKQLAVLSWYVPEDSRGQLPQLLQEYAQVRGWTITIQDRETIQAYMKKHIRKEIKRQLKKTLRTSGRQIRLKEDNFVAVFNRNMYAKTDMRGFLQGIDRLMESGHVLKNRPTSFISRVTIKDRNVVIKRYNHKSLFHSIRQSMQRSRARRSWLHGHRLLILCVNTPRPLAYIEKRIGPILWTSYIITQNVEGPNLEDVVNDPNTSDNHKQQIQQKINDLMRKLHENFITHGDFKRTNFIVSGGEPYVTDLDSMRVHMPGILFKHRQKKDVNRLKRMFTQTTHAAR